MYDMIYSLESLKGLLMSGWTCWAHVCHVQIVGNLPAFSSTNMPALITLDLSQCHLSGKVPQVGFHLVFASCRVARVASCWRALTGTLQLHFLRQAPWTMLQICWPCQAGP